jgi:hypothetical protein
VAIRREGKKLFVDIDGAIGESTPMFTYKMDNTEEIIMDLKGATYINSIGVKHWIVWAYKIPYDCKVTMVDAPFVIATQASTVVGFAPKQMWIESLHAPFGCDSCGAEETRLLRRGKDYEYKTALHPQWLNLPPTQECAKCKKLTLEPDFLPEKSFRFLERPNS